MSAPRLYDFPPVCTSVAEALEVAARNDLPNIMIVSEPEPGKIVILSATNGNAAVPGRGLNAAEIVYLLERGKLLALMPGAFDPVPQETEGSA